MAIVINRRPDEFSWSGNPVWYELYSAAAAADATIYFEVRVRFKYVDGVTDTSLFDTLFIFPYYPLAGNAKVDLAAILNSKLEYGLPGFPTDQREAYHASLQSGRFYIDYREITTATPDPMWSSDSANVRYVVKGGMNYNVWRSSNFWTNYFRTGGNGDDKYRFMTWQVSGRLAAITEKMYLTFMPTETPSDTLEVEAKVFWTDGTSNVAPFTGVAALLQRKGAVLMIPAGATQWDLQSLDANKTIHYWEVKLKQTNGAGTDIADYTEAFRFYADNRADYNGITIHYRGSIGGLESLRVLGLLEQKTAYESEEAEVAVDPDYYTGNSIPARRRVVNNKERYSWKGTSGWVGKEEQQRLRDLNLIREAWMERDGRWLPLNIMTGQLNLTDSEQSLYTMPVEFSFADNGDAFYSPLSIDFD